MLSGDGGGAGGDGDPIVSTTNSEKKSGYETNLYLYSVSTRKFLIESSPHILLNTYQKLNEKDQTSFYLSLCETILFQREEKTHE